MSEMAENEELAYIVGLCGRVNELRIERGFTQESMAAALGVPYERYKKYETRTPIPMYLIEHFAQLVGRDVQYIVTGISSVRRAPAPRRRRVKVASTP